jgi:hypothetical protein
VKPRRKEIEAGPEAVGEVLVIDDAGEGSMDGYI